ncbi:MAG: hypothetical protein PHW82_16110 [Bacteroidales bacterium]|nr:hypothetical protein [Bacteroidales bacterium]
MDKKFFWGISILLFLLIFSSVQAIEVSDLATGQQQISQDTTQLRAELILVKEQLQTLQKELVSRDSNLMHKSDLPQVYNQISIQIDEGLRWQLISNLFIVLFIFGALYLSKAKGWL